MNHEEREKYKDTLYIDTDGKVPFLVRLLYVFYPSFHIRTVIDVEETMPKHRVRYVTVQHNSVLDKLRNWWYRRQVRAGGIVNTPTKNKDESI